MSNLARTPESYAAWQRIKRSQELLPHEHEQPLIEMEKCSQELDLLAAGKSYLSEAAPSPIIHS